MENGWKWADIEPTTRQALGSIASAVFILLVVGALTGTWSLSGTMATGFSMHSEIGEIDQLGSRGGMDSMLPAPWIIIGAGTFGMLSEQLGLIRHLIDPLALRAKGTGRCIWWCSGREAD